MDTKKLQQTKLNFDGNHDTGNTSEQKPCFITSSAIIFTNLHNIAVEYAAKELGINAKDKNINQFIINTGMTDDGRTILNKADKVDPSKTKGLFGGGDEKFELGIVLQVNATPILVKDKDPEEKKNENQKAIDNAKKLILSGINKYFEWFAGSGSNTFKEDDLVEFIPDYNGGKVQIKDGEILGMEPEYKEHFVPNHAGGTKYLEKEDDVNMDKKLRIGYKVGYTISYK